MTASNDTASRRRTTDAKRAAFLDGIARRLPVEAACEAAGISRRLPYHWKAQDPAFAQKWAEIAADAEHRVNRRQVSEWREQLAQLDDKLNAIETQLGDVAALAMAGDPDAQARQADLRAQHQRAQEAAGALRQAIASGELHVARQEQERAERDRQAAATESDQLHQQQIAAAREIDDALRTLASAWATFTDVSARRQSAARRAGGSARPAFQHQLAAAFHAVAPSIADALRIARMNRAACQPMEKSIR